MEKSRARRISVWLIVCIAVSLPIHSAQAYVGPGLGLGTIALVLGLIASVLLAVFAIVWYPVKRLLKKRKTRAEIEDRQTME